MLEGFRELWKFKLVGAFPPNFEHPLAAKLYIRSENVLEVQE